MHRAVVVAVFCTVSLRIRFMSVCRPLHLCLIVICIRMIGFGDCVVPHVAPQVLLVCWSFSCMFAVAHVTPASHVEWKGFRVKAVEVCEVCFTRHTSLSHKCARNRELSTFARVHDQYALINPMYLYFILSARPVLVVTMNFVHWTIYLRR